MSRRILLATWGSWGDLFPYLGIAVRLRELGHSPVLATCAFHRPVVEQAGIEFAPMRPDVDPNDTDLMRRVMDPSRGSEVILRELIAPAVRQQYADLAPLAQQADVVVSHPVTFAAPIAAEEARRPWLSTVLAPLSFFSATDFPALPNMPSALALTRAWPWTAKVIRTLARAATKSWTTSARELRRERGLPPAGDPLYEGQFSRHGTLALFSRVLGEPQPDWPPLTHVTGFAWYNGPAASLSPELQDFLDRGAPPLVFTLGSSAVVAAGGFYEESARAVEALGARAVLLIGRASGNRPSFTTPNIFLAETAPHELLFPRASATIHHGGVGTTGQALRSGRPMLVVPFAHDQPDNAARVERLGVARVLYPTRYRADRVVPALRDLTGTTGFTTQAEAVARIVRAERGVGAACEAILACGGEAS